MTEEELLKALRNSERLTVLQALELLDTSAEEAFDRLTRLAGKLTGSPISLVSLVDADRQYFKSIFGQMPDSILASREIPLSHSICKHVVATGEPLIVTDARQNEMLNGNLAISELGVLGYLGMPLETKDGQQVGSFCVIDIKPREWSDEQINIIRELAESVMVEIDLRLQIKAREEIEKELIERNRQYRRVYHFANSTIEHMRDVLSKGADEDELLAYLDQMEKELSRL